MRHSYGRLRYFGGWSNNQMNTLLIGGGIVLLAIILTR